MQVIFIHSSDTDGRAFVGRFQTTSQNQGEDIEKKVQVCHNIMLLFMENLKNKIICKNIF